MADQNQTMITVKKSDGTTERITLAELKKRQAGIAEPVAAPAPVVAKQIVEEQKISPTNKVLEVKMVPIAPIIKEAKISVSEPALKSEDVKSLLHEEVPTSEHATSVVAPARVDQVDKIIAGLSFKVPVQIENRLRSCVQLRLKDIRSEADSMDMCLRSVKDGGLGLSETQAQEVVEKAKPNAVISNNPPKQIAVVEKIISQSIIAPQSDSIEKLVAKQNTSPTRPLSSSPTKPLMHDVKAKPISMNPLEEIQYFSLVDFRRLSSVATEAANRLKQKFINLKEESFLLFMQSWSGWQSSPLFLNYVEVVDSALSQKKTLAAVVGEKDKVSVAEVEALINMEKELDI